MHGEHRLQPRGGDVAPDAEAPQQLDIGRRERVGARIEGAIPRCARDAALVRDQDGAQAARGDRETRADRPAADDDEVAVPVYNGGIDRRGELAQLVRAAES
jgi:hypothetical protein